MSTLLTASRLKAARACSRLHKLRYIDGYRPAVEPDALRFGTLWHKGLEAFFKTLQLGLGSRHALQHAFEAVSTPDADPWDLARARPLLTGYHLRWEAEHAAWTVLSVEAEFSAELLNPETGKASRTWTLGGKIDLIIRDGARVRLVEHKTSSEDITPGSEYWRRLRMDGQVSMYFDGAAALGFEPADCLYDVVGKTRLRPYEVNSKRSTAETVEEFEKRVTLDIAEKPEKYYQRGDVVRLDSELEEHRFDTWQTAKAIRENELAGRHPRNPDSCVKWNKTCVFFDACTGAASLEDTNLFTRSTQVHPELAGPLPSKEEEAA